MALGNGLITEYLFLRNAPSGSWALARHRAFGGAQNKRCWLSSSNLNRSGANEKDMEHFSGPEVSKEFMGKSKILVNLLALTSETENIINSFSIDLLPAGAAFINLGRGEHVVDEDLIVALEKKTIERCNSGRFSKNLCQKFTHFATSADISMPHIARRPRIDFLTPQLIENIRRFRDRKPLLQEIDLERGY